MGEKQFKREIIKEAHLHGLDSLTALLSNLCTHVNSASAFLFTVLLISSSYLSKAEQIKKPHQKAG